MSEYVPTNPDHMVTLEAMVEFLRNCPYEDKIFWGKELAVSWKLPNEFTVLGRGAVIDPANFDYDRGFQVCIEDAARQLQKFEGYVMQKELHEQGKL